MLKELLFGRTMVPLLGRGLDALSMRQKTVAQNIANAQSEGYKRREVTFENELRTVLSRKQEDLFRTHPDHLPSQRDASRVHPSLRLADDLRDGPASEQVEIEREMTDLAQTQIKYEAEIKLARSQLDLLKMAIRGTH